jgi:hypothetical protein
LLPPHPLSAQPKQHTADLCITIRYVQQSQVLLVTRKAEAGELGAAAVCCKKMGK